VSTPTIDTERFPEYADFTDAVAARRPDAGTWCAAWTVRDVVIHQTGNAEELARVLGGHLAHDPVPTRTFEVREAPYRHLNDADLWAAFTGRMAELGEVAEAAEALPPDTDVAWTGRTMKVPWFAEHMRSELALHTWDLTGDDDRAHTRLAQPWMTEHSVVAVGRPLLRRGTADLQLAAGERVDARLRVPDEDDVIVSAATDSTEIRLGAAEGEATLETDAATRVLLLWGRRPADPGRIRSRVGPEELGRVRTLLSGY
jgi:hypothetical protein